MPSQMLHVLHGSSVCRAIGPAKALKSPNFPFFCLGCQGPDIFYHNQRTRPTALEYGSLLHRRNYGEFSSSLLSRAQKFIGTKEDRDKSLAYAVGFMLHAFLDRALHPYIISRAGGAGIRRTLTDQGRGISVARLHMFLERILDVAMLEDLDGIAVDSWPQNSLLSDPAREGGEILIPLLLDALRESFPQRAEDDPHLSIRLANALKDASYFYTATSPEPEAGPGLAERLIHAGREKGMEATAYLHPVKVPGHTDFLNKSHSEWLYPCEPGMARQESVKELFDTAVKDACSALEPFFAMGDRMDARALAQSIGNGNLSLRTENGERCSPVYFSALELEKILSEEYERRFQSF